jgi:zeaxanthin glucosyltransferase
MAHYAIFSPPYVGHLYPLGMLGRELVRRGHRVTFVGAARMAPILNELQLPLYLWDADSVPRVFAKTLWHAFRLFRSADLIRMRDYFRWQTEVTLQLLPDISKELAVDGIIADQMVVGASTVAEYTGVPLVSVCTAAPWSEDASVPPTFTAWPYAEGPLARARNRWGYAVWRWFVRPMLSIVNGYRRKWGLRPLSRVDETYSALAQISQMFDGLDLPRLDMPEVMHNVGSLGLDRPVPPHDGFPWDALDDRPMIYASMGTVPGGENVRVLRTIMEACGNLDATVVLSLGKWNEQEGSTREDLGPAPRNTILVDFAPQLALLDKAAVLITHAGMNSTLEAIGRGVPMVALPYAIDQPGIATRIERAGVGLQGSFRRCRPAELRRLVERVLTEESFRHRAKELRQAMLAAGGARRAAAIAEQALTTGRPVYRGTEPSNRADQHRRVSELAGVSQEGLRT